MRKENRTNHTDLHILQWRHGCAAECHSNGLVTFLQGTDEYAYNGETLTFNLSKHWKPLVLEHGIIWNRESVSRLERKCVETLTSLSELQREGKVIKKALPDIYFFVKASGSSEQQVLVCLATGFYPKHVQMEIRRDQTRLPDEQLNSSGIRSNADGSFQLKKSLKILPSERSRYQCVVTEWILPITYMAYRGGVLLYIVILVSLIVVPIVLTIYLLIKYIKHPKKQKTPKTPSQVKLLKTRADLAAALNASSDEENATDDSMEEVQIEELHETQSLCEAKETPAAARGAMGSKNISLPNFAMKREDTDQNTVTQNALLLPLQRNCRSKTISMPALALERKDNSDSS
ncbi:hereditary hemochromatosis protein homolog isoform X2 [Cyprinus carpio]|uniref:Hereditary hemochromatosis protein homolog isoform X2 n=1 Tax=Cyprinus carpio TaxID=7962 RepID=A0A9R0AK63_CYPCA|nr:hereditary hemochromatosis protein homolog isoform X2 [Cyprinus carpio]